MRLSRLFVLSALCLLGLGAKAQTFTATWTKPVPQAVDMYEYSTFPAADSEEPGDTIVYYLYNVGAAAFFTEGNAWGTQASVGATGLQVAITKYTIDDVWDEKTVFINDYSLAKKAWKLLFIDSENASYVDRGSQANYFWEIVPQGNKNFRIKGADENPEYNSWNGEYWFGMASDAENTAINPRIDLDADPNANVDWQFLTPEAYEAFLPSVAIYTAAMNLKAQIEWAMEQGATAAELADEFAVYNNTSSTVEELEAAAKSAYNKGRYMEIKPYFDGITPGAKNDVSGVITNNDFSSGTVEGWDITYEGGSSLATNIGYQGASYTNGDVTISGFIEAWKDTNSPNFLGDGSITQTIPGLPQGKYTLAVDVIANNQGRISSNDNPDGLPDDVELYAQASEDGKTYKTSMATKNGAPEHFEFTFIHTGGDMTMGLRVVGSAEATMPANWIAMDNLELYYYGPVDDDPDKALLDVTIEEALAAFPLASLDKDVIAYVGDKENFRTVITEAQAATADYLDHLDKVKAALAQLQASVAAYDNFDAAVKTWEQHLVEFDFDSDEWADYADFIGNFDSPEGYPELVPEEVVKQQSLSIEEIEAYIKQVNDLFRKAFAGSLEDGTDVTMLLTNADLVDGRTGWTTSATGGNFTAGGYELYHAFEAWHATTFNFSQTIEDLPIGVYELSTQGYVRYLDGQDAINNADQRPENIPIYIYMNDSKTNLPNWLDYPQESGFFDEFNEMLTEKKASEGWWSSQTTGSYLTDGNGYEYPDNMTGAAATFYKGDYTVRTFGLVANEGESFTLGVKGENLPAQYWPLWGQFKLTYRAFNPEVMQEALETALETIDVSQPMARSLYDQVNKLNEEATEAMSAADGEKMFAVLKEIYALSESINTSVALFKELNEAAEALVELAAESTSDKQNEAYDLANEIIGHIDARDIENEDAEAYMKKIARMKTLLRLPEGYENATDEAPVEFTGLIENPDFETGNATGWTYKFEVVTNIGFQNNSTYSNTDEETGDEILISNFIEGWRSGNSPIGDGSIQQTIAYLPEGTYVLEADIIANLQSRAAGEIAEEGEGMYLFAAEDGGEKSAVALATANGQPLHFAVTFKKASEESDLTIGVEAINSTANWLAADNFQLFYYGTGSSKKPDDDQSGIDELTQQNLRVEYFTLDGRKVNSVQKGVVIQKVTLANGTVVIRKISK